MIIKLLPTQIPFFWEAIKLAAVQADEIEEKNRSPYLLKILHSLLNDKSQCFARMDQDKKLQGLAVTKVMADNISGEKSLSVQILYSWTTVDDIGWRDDFAFIKEFAVHEKCKHIVFESRHNRVHEIGRMLGFKETTRVFGMEV